MVNQKSPSTAVAGELATEYRATAYWPPASFWMFTFARRGWPIVSGWEAPGSSIWGICPQVNAGYPFLQGHTSSAACAAPAAPAATPAALTATLSRSRARVTSGTTLRIGLRVANTGGTAAQGVTSCITAPRGLAIVNAKGARRSGRTACFTVGAVAAGATAARSVTVRASASRRRTVTVTGSASGTGLARVTAPRVKVTLLPRRSGR